MTKRKQRNLLKILLALLCSVVAGFGCLFMPSSETKALSSTANAVKAGNGTEMWNATASVFRGEVLDDLLAKLFHGADPVTYVKNNDAGDYVNYGQNVQMNDAAPKQYYVVPAPVINSGVGNVNNGLVVKLDGKEWTAASLTLADVNGKTDQVILTLYLADDSGSSQFYTNRATDKGNNMYSRSLIRNQLLTDTTWRLFRSTGANGFADRFLVQPAYVEYQRTETAFGRSNVNGGWYNEPNDAWGALANGWYTSSAINYQPSDTYGGVRYDAWKDDYIWIPSVTEAGAGVDLADSATIWQLTPTQRMHSGFDRCWLRSGGYANYGRCGTLENTSGIYAVNFVDATNGVRPAIHLNLTQAQTAAAYTASVPSDVSVEFDGTAQTVAGAKAAGLSSAAWYDANKMTLVCNNGAEMKNAGTYTCTATLNPGYIWDNNTSAPRNFRFEITQKALTVNYTQNISGLYDVAINPSSYAAQDTNRPTDSDLVVTYTRQGNSAVLSPPFASDGQYTAHVAWRTGLSPQNYSISNASQDFTYTRGKVSIPSTSASEGYTGQDINFPVSDFDASETEMIVGTSGAVWDPVNEFLTVKDAGNYSVTVRLKNPSTHDWTDNTTADRTLNFTVTKFGLQATVSGAGGATNVPCARGDRVPVTFVSALKSGDAIQVDFYAEPGRIRLARDVVISSASQSVDLNTTALREGSTYTVTAELTGDAKEKNKNYTLSLLRSPTLEVSQALSAVHLVWRLSHGSTNAEQDVDDQQSATYGNALTYDGTEFLWRVDTDLLLISGYELDPTHGTNGYLDAAQTDAGSYTTSVKLISTNGGTDPGIFEIHWSIDKAKFDLGKVKWRGNGTLVYSGFVQTMELEGLPAGLTANYGGICTFKDVNQPQTATVTDFTVADPANYIEPDQADPSTYLGNFDWQIQWVITPATIRVQWGKELVTDPNGKSFNVSVLRDENFRPAVTHTYYKSDASGNVTDPTPIDPSNISVPSSGIEYYVCEIQLVSNDGNYVLSGNLRSPVFAVSDFGTAATFTPNRVTFDYTGTSIGPQFTNDAGIKKDGYELKYYHDDGTPIASAPSTVGKYRVGIELVGDVANTYFIAGDDTFDFEIRSREIAENWNEGVKPPRLQINRTEAGLIEYEIVADASGAAVNFSDLQAGVAYRIRAKIKAAHAGSVTFVGGASETAWKSFMLSQSDLANLQDPNDPSVYPEDPDDPNKPIPDPENPDDPKKPEGDYNIPLWQMIAILLSLVLGIVFFVKGNGYRSEAKKLRRKAETVRKRATDPSVGMGIGFVLGMDETFAGMTGSVWTGIACGFIGLCALSLAWMITGKRKYTRASEDLEAAEQEAYLAEKRREVARQMQEEQREEERRLREEEDRKRREEELQRQREQREEERRLREEELQRQREEREEERKQRNDEMQMMLMMMNKNGGGNGAGAQTTYDAMASTEEIVARVVAQLLPSIQQSLQPAVVQTLPAADDRAISELRDAVRELRDAVGELKNPVAPPAQYEEQVTETITETVEEPEPQYQEVVEEVVEEIVEEPAPEFVQVIEEAAAVEEPEEKPKKEKIPAEPKLTLDEAYALLSREQKKFFDGLRAYAMSKEKCKEKKTTYFILCGQSTANPLIKLCIKKDVTVARFKLEDEYTKSLRRTAGSEGTKIKVKETEVSISDAQAFATAKEMIDLREDQIERYEEFLKEQRLLAKQSK